MNCTSTWVHIHESISILEATKCLHPLFEPNQECPLFLQQEKEYLALLKSELKAEQVKIEYLEALEQLKNAEWVTVHAYWPWDSNRTELWPLWSTLSTMPTPELAYWASCVQWKVEDAHCIVSTLEATLSFTLPWLPNSPQHQEAIQLHNERKYHCLLDDLEHSAISCQFELEKLGLPRTGKYFIMVCRNDVNFPILDYKTHQHVSQLIGKQGKALHSTLQKYDNVAAAMSSPWYSSSQLPKHSWAIVRSWWYSLTQVGTGALLCSNLSLDKAKHAKEELTIIGIEAHRIQTSIRDKELSLKKIIQDLTDSNLILATYIKMAFKWHLQANVHLCKKLCHLESHPNCLSPHGPGTWIGSEQLQCHSAVWHCWSTS